MGGIFVFSCEESIPIQDISEALRELWSSCGRGMIPASVVLVDPSYEILEEISTLDSFSERLVQIKNEFGDLISFWIGPKWGPTENERCLENLGEKILNYIYSPPSFSEEFYSIFPKKLLPRKEILVKWLEKILPLSNWDYDKELSIITQEGLYIINPVSNRVYLIPKNCQLCRDKCSWVRRYVCIDLEGWKGWNNCELTDKELLFLSKAWIIANNKYNNSVKEKIEAAIQTPCVKY